MKNMIGTLKMLRYSSLLLGLIAGCSPGNDGEQSCVFTQSTYSYEYDQISSTGLTLKATGNEYTFIPFEEMEAEYIELEVCAVDNITPGPTVIFESFNNSGSQIELARYNYATQTVYIDTDQEDWLPIRNCISDREFLRHEFMHHVLYLNSEDVEHTNPTFERCEAFGYKTCNGEYCE